MASSTRDPSVPAIREALRLAISRSSLRAVARQLSMSPTGLSELVEGERVPYAKTVRKLLVWYAEHGPDPAGGMAPEVAQAMLAALVETLPPRRRAGAIAKLRETLRQLHRDAKAAPPGWLG